MQFADRSWRKSLIFQLLEVSGTMVEQAKCPKQGVKVSPEFLKFITAYEHYSRSDFGGQLMEVSACNLTENF